MQEKKQQCGDSLKSGDRPKRGRLSESTRQSSIALSDSISNARVESEAQLQRGRLSFLETLQSVLWAMLGVQKEKNARRDFRYARPSQLILVGIAVAVLFVLTLVLLVKLILSQAAPL